MKTKKEKNYIYEGLGFKIILSEVQMEYIRGEWVAAIDVEEISRQAFSLMPSKPSNLTGNEIAFIRVYLNLNKTQFANIFGVSHTAVSKWEHSKDKKSCMSFAQEKDLRLYILNSLRPKPKEFHDFYKSLNEIILAKETTPFKIKLAS